jgi:hypothetical protein
MAVVESLATLVGNFPGREYQELKRRVLATHGRSRWEKLDSLLSFPKMGANKRLVLSRLNSLKPATLEELYMAIFLRVLPDSYREHFAHTELRTAEEIAAKADGLWEMRGCAAAMVAAILRPASLRRPSPGRGQQDGGGGGGDRHNNNRGRGHQATRCKPPCLFTQGNRGGCWQQLSPLQSAATAAMAATAADGRPRLHPTTNLALLRVTTIHMFSGRAKLCFIRDEMSGKDFLVDTGAAISLLPFQSAAAATGPQLQAVNKQAIKTWDFVNNAVKFNGGEYRFAFLRANVPFPIVGLDFLRYFGMQVNPPRY